MRPITKRTDLVAGQSEIAQQMGYGRVVDGKWKGGERSVKRLIRRGYLSFLWNVNGVYVTVVQSLWPVVDRVEAETREARVAAALRRVEVQRESASMASAVSLSGTSAQSVTEGLAETQSLNHFITPPQQLNLRSKR